MNSTELVVTLIKEYRREHARYRRAQNAILRMINDGLLKELRVNGFGDLGRGYHFNTKPRRDMRNYFIDSEERPIEYAFTSKRMKAKAVALAKRQLSQIEADVNKGYITYSPEFIAGKRDHLDKVCAGVVNTKLGKMWRTYIDALIEQRAAYDSRWQVRCAIKSINKMDIAPKIKFGQCKKGSMSEIYSIVVDGHEIPVKKWLDNAEFESVILNG